LGYDTVNGTFVTFKAADYGPVSSLGIEWSSSSVTLIVNGAARQTLTASDFGVSAIPLPYFDLLDLYASGPNTQMRFDNVCMGAGPRTSLDVHER
jgi:hypothetical protein